MPTLPRTRKPEPPRGTSQHEEWLIDQAGDQTFPASDASAPAQPGSTESVNRMHDEGRATPPTDKEIARKPGKK